MTTPDSVLGRFVQRITSHYPLGQRAAALGAALCPDSATGGAVATIDYSALASYLEQQPDLQLAVSRAVQHPRFGGLKQRHLVEADLAAIEPGLLTGLLFGFILPESLLTAIEAEEARRYWLRVLWRSVGARVTVRSMKLASPASSKPLDVDAGDLFSAAMLVDIGKLALFAELKQTYARFVSEARERGHDLCQLELDSLGFDHRILTSRVLEQWPIPPTVVRCLNDFAQAALTASESRVATLAEGQIESAILLAVDYLAELVDGGREELAGPLVQIAAEIFGWHAEDLERWTQQIVEPVRHLANCFGVELSEPVEISAGLATAWKARQDQSERTAAGLAIVPPPSQ